MTAEWPLTMRRKTYKPDICVRPLTFPFCKPPEIYVEETHSSGLQRASSSFQMVEMTVEALHNSTL